MKDKIEPLLMGEVVDEESELTLGELCRICHLPAEQLIELVEEGIAEPIGRDDRHWRFQVTNVRRVHCAIQLRRDLGINWSGAALALDLLDEIETLRLRLRRLGGEEG